MSQLVFKGRVWKFGENIDTDVIIPTKYLELPFEEMIKHVMEPLNPGFAREMQAGDIIVAGKNFGCGSSREQAPLALKSLGISAIIAESFARIFFRNAITIGLPALTCEGIGKYVKQGDMLLVDVESGQIQNLTTYYTLAVKPPTQQMLEILRAGGAISLLKMRARQQLCYCTYEKPPK